MANYYFLSFQLVVLPLTLSEGCKMPVSSVLYIEKGFNELVTADRYASGINTDDVDM